jgi:PhnB protein
MKMNPYLNFKGNCEEAMRFYAKVLGGEILAMMTFEGTPAAEHVPAATRKNIMHACLKFGETRLMASDCPNDQFEPMKGMYVALHPETPDEAERIFRDLSEGATVQMPLAETFWAHRFGMMVDRFGTPWMINCEKPM